MRFTRRHFLMAFLALQLADVASTWVALGGGRHHEANPFAVWLMAGGLPALLLMKMVATLLMAFLMELMARPDPKHPKVSPWADATIQGCCFVMVLVVSNNLLRLL